MYSTLFDFMFPFVRSYRRRWVTDRVQRCLRSYLGRRA
jgi:hypothetical protein